MTEKKKATGTLDGWVAKRIEEMTSMAVLQWQRQWLRTWSATGIAAVAATAAAAQIGRAHV